MCPVSSFRNSEQYDVDCVQYRALTSSEQYDGDCVQYRALTNSEQYEYDVDCVQYRALTNSEQYVGDCVQYRAFYVLLLLRYSCIWEVTQKCGLIFFNNML